MRQEHLGYVYVITRLDIPQPFLSVQVCHATLAATNAFGQPNAQHPNLIVCTVKNEQELHKSLEKLRARGVPCVAWCEEDMDNRLTAIATGILHGDARKPLRNYLLLGPATPRSELSPALQSA